jgi:hypothetical protein
MIWAITAFAQSQPLRADIPFEFYVGEKLLPAGTYILSPTAQGDAIRISDQKGNESVFIMALVYRPNHAMNLNRVTFNRYGNTSFLSSIYWIGFPNGKQLATSKVERQLAQNGSTPLPVAILVK